MQKRLRISAIVLLSILAASFAAYAILKSQTPITNNALITGYGLELWNTHAPATQKVTIEWNTLEQGSSKDTDTLYSITKELRVKNIGDYNCSVCWFIDPLTPLPTGVTLTAEYSKHDAGLEPYLAWPASTTFIGFTTESTYVTGLIPVGGYSEAIRFTLTISDTATRGAITFNIILQAATTLEG